MRIIAEAWSPRSRKSASSALVCVSKAPMSNRKKIIRESVLNVLPADNLDDAAQKI